MEETEVIETDGADTSLKWVMREAPLDLGPGVSGASRARTGESRWEEATGQRPRAEWACKGPLEEELAPAKVGEARRLSGGRLGMMHVFSVKCEPENPAGPGILFPAMLQGVLD